MGREILDDQKIVSIRIPDINKDQVLLGNYYYNMIQKFIPKNEKNIEALKFIFEESENFFITINGVRFIIKYEKLFYTNIKEFEEYMFKHILSASIFDIDVNIAPVMITKEDKEILLQKFSEIENPESYNNYTDMIHIYNHIDDYFVLNIKINNDVIIIDQLQN